MGWDTGRGSWILGAGKGEAKIDTGGEVMNQIIAV